MTEEAAVPPHLINLPASCIASDARGNCCLGCEWGWQDFRHQVQRNTTCLTSLIMPLLAAKKARRVRAGKTAGSRCNPAQSRLLSAQVS